MATILLARKTRNLPPPTVLPQAMPNTFSARARDTRLALGVCRPFESSFPVFPILANFLAASCGRPSAPASNKHVPANVHRESSHSAVGTHDH